MRRGFHSIHTRLFLLILSSMLAMLTVASFLYYRQTTGIVHDKISLMAEKNISQTVGLFALLLESYDSVSKSLSTNSELLRLLEDQEAVHSPGQGVIPSRMISNILGSIFYSRDDIVGIHIITDTQNIYSYERNYAGIIDANYAAADWFQKLTATEGEMLWYGLSQGSVINRLQREPVFTFGRKLYDLTNYRPLGYILIETEPKAMLAALSNVTISPNSLVYIVDKDDQVVATTNRDPELVVDVDELPRPAAGEVIAEFQTDRLVVSANAGRAGWTVFGLTPKADITAEVTEIRRSMFVVVLLLILLSTAIATIVSRSISSPLKLLIREMKQVEMGNFKGSVNVKSYQEVNTLVTSFNRMVERMDQLIKRITESSIREKNAQLQALQSQVNPHFLYNTLDMIYWMLDERENDRLGRVILALSKMFRYSSDWEEASRTSLGSELEQMRHYLTVIEGRLEGRMRTEIDVDERWLDAVLPKMTIQPIIENAVKCGLEPAGGDGELRVHAEAVGRELHIVIEDNGVGVDERTLARIRGLLEGKDPAESRSGEARRGIGLPNVHRRIALMYGEPYGLRIDSVYGRGTKVTIVIPSPANAAAGLSAVPAVGE